MVKITNQKQMKRLVALMENDISLAKNFRRGVPQTGELKIGWEGVASILNDLGPPIRNWKEWQKVWFDAKFKVKKKLIFNKRQLEATGGGPFKQKHLNDVDEAISKLLSYNELLDPVGKVSGVTQPSQTRTISPPRILSSTSTVIPLITPIKQEETINKSTAALNISELSTGAANETSFLIENEASKPKKNMPLISTKTALSREIRIVQEMLEKQIKAQESSYNEVKDSLQYIKNQLKASARYDRKRFSLEKKRFKLYKMQQIEDNKLKTMDLEIRKRQLDIEEQKLRLLESGKEKESIF